MTENGAVFTSAPTLVAATYREALVNIRRLDLQACDHKLDVYRSLETRSPIIESN